MGREGDGWREGAGGSVLFFVYVIRDAHFPYASLQR